MTHIKIQNFTGTKTYLEITTHLEDTARRMKEGDGNLSSSDMIFLKMELDLTYDYLSNMLKESGLYRG